MTREIESVSFDGVRIQPSLGDFIVPVVGQTHLPLQTAMHESSSKPEQEGCLKREISSHNLNMIAIAGSVGTGLIIGVGSSLALGKCPLF
jgi:amino acid permease